MAATVAVVAARLTSLRLLDTGSPALVPAQTWAYVPVILRQSAQKMHKPVTFEEQGCPAPRRRTPTRCGLAQKGWPRRLCYARTAVARCQGRPGSWIMH